jgi:IS5 family transposase
MIKYGYKKLRNSPMSTFKLPNKFLSVDVYKACLDQNHFLVKLRELFDWNGMAQPLESLAKNAEGGRPRTPPVTLLKALFISFLFDHSDRETEFAATNNLLVKYFLGLSIDEKAPDHSTFSRFRDEVLKAKGVDFFRDLFRSLLAQAKRKGVTVSVIDALDATHTFAKVDTDQPDDPNSPRDPDATWGCKGNETKTTADGEKVQIPKYFLGYKAHLLVESQAGIVTGYHATPGHVADIDGGDWLIHRILTEEERQEIQVLLADKGYGCPVWINLLEKYTGIMTAFSLPNPMVKRGEHKERWQTYLMERTSFRKDRSVVERANGDLKDNHGLRRSRYRGIAKYTFQVAMSVMARNLKIFVRQLTGARFKPI